jgi:hypothetical protein
MVGEQVRKSAMSRVGLGDDQKPGRIFVEAMNDAGTAHAADSREAVPAMGDQSIYKRAVGVTWGRMDDKTSGFVEHENSDGSSVNTPSTLTRPPSIRARSRVLDSATRRAPAARPR